LPLADAADAARACQAAALDAEQRWQSDTAAKWWGHALEVFDQHPDPDTDRDDLVVAQVAALARAGRAQTVLDVIDAALLDAVRRGRMDSAGRLASTLLRTSGSWPWAAYGDDPAPLLARLAGLDPLARRIPALTSASWPRSPSAAATTLTGPFLTRSAARPWSWPSSSMTTRRSPTPCSAAPSPSPPLPNGPRSHCSCSSASLPCPTGPSASMRS